MEARKANAREDSKTNTVTSLTAVKLKQKEYTKNGCKEDTMNKPAKQLTPLLSKLRRSYENHVKSKADGSKGSHKAQAKAGLSSTKFQNDPVKQRRKSYSGPSYTCRKKNFQFGRKFLRSKSWGSRELTSQPQRQADGQIVGDFPCNENEPKNVSNENKVNKSVMSVSEPNRVSLYSILRHFELKALKLQRKPEQKWGIELTEVDEESSTSQNYTEFKNKARPLLSFNSITDQSDEISPPSITHTGHLMTELREKFRKSVKHRKCGIKEPLSVVSTEENHQPQHGVRITGLTEQGVATRDGMLAVDDLIVEVRVVSYSVNFSVQNEKVTILQRG